MMAKYTSTNQLIPECLLLIQIQNASACSSLYFTGETSGAVYGEGGDQHSTFSVFRMADGERFNTVIIIIVSFV